MRVGIVVASIALLSTAASADEFCETDQLLVAPLFPVRRLELNRLAVDARELGASERSARGKTLGAPWKKECTSQRGVLLARSQ